MNKKHDQLFDKKDYTQTDIERLFLISAEESINLDFKAADSLGHSDGEKNEIAKDVSAFANSDGGMIIYGVAEREHKAHSASFLDGDEYSKEWLEQVINSRVQKRIPGVAIIPFRFDGDIGKTVYVLKIPQSTLAPHMASDKRFYKRFNFQSVPMEEYEVRDLFSRKQRTEIEIADILCVQGGSSSTGELLSSIEYLLRFQIHNVGNTIEERYKLEVYIPTPLTRSDNQSDILKEKIRDEGAMSVFSIPNKSPIYQDEVTTVISGRVKILKKTIALLADPGIRLKLFFSNGTVEKTVNLLDKLSYRDQRLRDRQWND